MRICSQIVEIIYTFSSQIANNMILRTEAIKITALDSLIIDERIDFRVSFSFLLPEKHIFAFPVLIFLKVKNYAQKKK